MSVQPLRAKKRSSKGMILCKTLDLSTESLYFTGLWFKALLAGSKASPIWLFCHFVDRVRSQGFWSFHGDWAGCKDLPPGLAYHRLGCPKFRKPLGNALTCSTAPVQSVWETIQDFILQGGVGSCRLGPAPAPSCSTSSSLGDNTQRGCKQIFNCYFQPLKRGKLWLRATIYSSITKAIDTQNTGW